MTKRRTYTVKGEKATSTESMLRIAVTSGVALALFSFIFALQGMLYRNAYLSAFGLDSNQFPVEGGRLTVLVTFGWLEASSVVLERMGPAYFQIVQKSWLVLVVVALIMLMVPWAIRWIRARRANKTRENAQVPPGPSSWKRGADLMQWPWYQRLVMAAVLWFAATALLPSLLVVGAFLVLLLVLPIGMPFESVGARKAQEFCDTDPSKMTMVSYRLPGEAVSDEWGVMIECGADYCAVINRKSIEVIRAEHVSRILPGRTSNKARYEVPILTPAFCPDVFYSETM